MHRAACIIVQHGASQRRSFRVFGQPIMLQQRLLAMQDELYCQHLTDACHDAVRQLLGPRKALLWSRQVKGCLLQMGACFMLLFPPLFTEQGAGLQEPCDSIAGLLLQLTRCKNTDTTWVIQKANA